MDAGRVRRTTAVVGALCCSLLLVVVLLARSEGEQQVADVTAQTPGPTLTSTAPPTPGAQPATGAASPVVATTARPGTAAEPTVASRLATESPRIHFGTLVTDVKHADQERAAGLDTAMVELQWRYYEPSEGKFNTAYARRVKGQVDRLRAAGLRVTLGLGLHFEPAWALAKPGGRFVDQRGKSSEEVNLVFNAVLRGKADRYFAEIDRDLGLQNFAAVRLTSGGNAEVLYPGNSYWAFDRNAQNGVDLPRTMKRNPLPGWKPGDREVSMRPVSKGQVRAWADWYVAALVDTVSWQQRSLRDLGFTGRFEILTPGSGIRPKQYDSAVSAYLPDGLLGRGAAWDKIYAGLGDRSRVVAYVSSVGDGSGGDDTCVPSDRSVALTSARAASWSATRWISRIADQYGLAVAGENPGFGLPVKLNNRYQDRSSTGMMSSALRQVRACGLDTFYWAHDLRLWDGTVPFPRYADAIAKFSLDPTGPSR